MTVPITVDDRDQVARVLDERCEARLVLAAVRLLAERGALERQRDARAERVERVHENRRERRARGGDQRARAARRRAASGKTFASVEPSRQAQLRVGRPAGAADAHGRGRGPPRAAPRSRARARSTPSGSSISTSPPAAATHRRALACAVDEQLRGLQRDGADLVRPWSPRRARGSRAAARARARRRARSA